MFFTASYIVKSLCEFFSEIVIVSFYFLNNMKFVFHGEINIQFKYFTTVDEPTNRAPFDSPGIIITIFVEDTR